MTRRIRKPRGTKTHSTKVKKPKVVHAKKVGHASGAHHH